MDDGPRIDALTYLDRFFDAVREEARANPAFSARLVEALGGDVVFDSEQAAALLNPLKLAAEGEAKLRGAAEALSLKDIKSVLRLHSLATSVDTKGRSLDALQDMLVERAIARLGERRQSRDD